jgi:hypothetical protein
VVVDLCPVVVIVVLAGRLFSQVVSEEVEVLVAEAALAEVEAALGVSAAAAVAAVAPAEVGRVKLKDY